MTREANGRESPQRAPAQGIVEDERGQDQPADKARAQQTGSRRQHGQSDPPMRGDRGDTSDPKNPKPRE